MSAAKKIDEVRAQIADLNAQIAAPEASSFSRAEMTRAITALIASWHDQAQERVTADMQQLAAGRVAYLLQPDGDLPSDAGDVAIESRAWLTFCIGKEAMLAKFQPVLDAMPEGVTAAERARRRSELDRKLVDAEIREASLICQAEDEGIVTTPRPDQRPEAAILIGWGT